MVSMRRAARGSAVGERWRSRCVPSWLTIGRMTCARSVRAQSGALSPS